MVCIEIRGSEQAGRQAKDPPHPLHSLPLFAWCPLINLQHFCYIGNVQNKLTTPQISETEGKEGGGAIY